MARCMRCNKFLLFGTKSGYCSNCDILIVNENAEKERKAREDMEKRLQQEAEQRRTEEELRKKAEEARKAEEEHQRRVEEERRAEEERQRRAEEARKAEEERRLAAEEARKAEEERRRTAEESRKAEEARKKTAETARAKAEEKERKAREAREAEEKSQPKAADESQAVARQEESGSDNPPSNVESETESDDAALENMTKEAMKDASVLLDKVLDLLKSLFSYSCRDFKVSYRLSEENINNFVQLRYAIVTYFARLIAGVNMTIGADRNETSKLVEQLAGEELATDIDYVELEPIELSHHDIPWAMQYFIDADEVLFNDPMLNLDSLTFTPLFLKMMISITGRIQQMHMDILTKENNEIISGYTDVITEHYVDEAERITGVRPQVSVTTATITRNDEGDVTKVVVNKDKNKSTGSASKEG